MFDDERAMVRLDMSEYQERHTVARLGRRAARVRRLRRGRPAHRGGSPPPVLGRPARRDREGAPEVFDVLLQILDDGRLTDGQGRTVDFRNTVIVMTSNVRSAEALREHFRPEFLNRIDEVVEFHPLTRDQIAEIVELQLRGCARGSPSAGCRSS
jgi:ATP-dependent Clp protease ATP-binding subunit ClpB